MRVLYLTVNPNPGSTNRLLIDWLRLGQGLGMCNAVAVNSAGDLGRYMAEMGIAHRFSPMPLPDRWRPWACVGPDCPIGGSWARRLGVDVVHCQEHDVYPFGRPLARLLGVPVVCHVRCMVEREYSVWAFGGKRKPNALIWNSREQRRNCEAAIEGVVEQNRQHVIPEGVTVSEFAKSASRRNELRAQWGIRPDQIAVGSASALREGKRIDAFLDLIVALRQSDPNVIGVFAGGVTPNEPEYGRRIEPRLREMQQAGLLRWLGHLEPVEPYYHAIDLFVSASISETFGMSVCEAMACERPVVGYAGGAVREVVGDTGLIVENDDLPALIDAARTLVRDPAQRAERGARARQRVASEFDPAKSFEKVRAIYESVLAT